VGRRPIEIALVGAGVRGVEIYGEIIRHHPIGARLVAVADLDPEQASRAAAVHEQPVAVYPSG